MNVRQLYHSLPSPPSTNIDLRHLAYDPYEFLPKGAIGLDLGCKSARGRYVFSANGKSIKLFGLDLQPYENVDVVADGQALPFLANTLDVVLCVSVLEYVHHPEELLHEVFRVLKPGGLLYLSVPFVFRYAPDPDDLYRFSVRGIEVLCASFERIQSGFNRGPASTICDLLVHFNAILFCFNNRRMYNLLVDLFQWALFWIKYFDRWLGAYEMAYIMCNGVFFLGRKPFERER